MSELCPNKHEGPVTYDPDSPFKLSPVTLEEAAQAQKNIKGIAVRTPLIKLNWHSLKWPNLEIYLKLENLQPIGSFKVRGAGNAIVGASQDALARHGVVTGSAGGPVLVLPIT
jgi:threonine dehydratase